MVALHGALNRARSVRTTLELDVEAGRCEGEEPTAEKVHLQNKRLIVVQSFSALKEDEVMPAKFEDDLIWVAAGAPLSDSTFLSSKIKDLCGDLPIFWLRPTYSTSKYTLRHLTIQSHVKQNQTKILSDLKGTKSFLFEVLIELTVKLSLDLNAVELCLHPPNPRRGVLVSC